MPDVRVRERAIAAGLEIIQSHRRTVAVHVGCALADAARRVPEEIADRTGDLRRHEQTWTQLAAWASVVAGTPDRYTVETLRDAVERFSTLLGGFERPLGPTMILDPYGERHLAEQFLLGALEAILTHWPDHTDAWMPLFVETASHSSVRHASSLERVLRRFGKTSDADHLTAWADDHTRGLRGATERLRTFGRAILECLAGLVDQSLRPPTTSLPFFHVGAFFTCIGYRHLELSDTMEFSDDVASQALRVLVRCWARASKIPLDQLSAEARELLEAFKTHTATAVLPAFLLFVDIDDPDFTEAQFSAGDLECLEHALHVPSAFIVSLATNCLDGTCTIGQRQRVVERVLEVGTGWSLGAAAHLVRRLPARDATDLLMNRLAKPMTRGCSFLFERLADLSPRVDNRLRSALSMGLAFDGETAAAAARVAATHAHSDQCDIQHLLQEAYDYWTSGNGQVAEYNRTGIVAPSPRAEILRALWAIESPDVPTLVGSCVDSCSDITDMAYLMLMDRLRASPAARTQFTSMAVEGAVPPQCLGRVLEKKIPLSRDESATLTSLLRHADPQVRWATMHLLDETYLSPHDITTEAQALKRDPDDRIRERVFGKFGAYLTPTRSSPEASS